jgi:putative protein kinase ArgK-like GTPase of G3E family
MPYTYTITAEGLEKIWEAVRGFKEVVKEREKSYDKPTVHAKYWTAKQKLVEVVMKVFGEDWGDATKEVETKEEA